MWLFFLFFFILSLVVPGEERKLCWSRGRRSHAGQHREFG